MDGEGVRQHVPRPDGEVRVSGTERFCGNRFAHPLAFCCRGMVWVWEVHFGLWKESNPSESEDEECSRRCTSKIVAFFFLIVLNTTCASFISTHKCDQTLVFLSTLFEKRISIQSPILFAINSIQVTTLAQGCIVVSRSKKLLHQLITTLLYVKNIFFGPYPPPRPQGHNTCAPRCWLPWECVHTIA